MFQDNSCLTAIVNRQGLQVATLIDLRTKKAESVSPQLIQGFWQKLMRNSPKIVVMSPTFETKDNKKGRSGMGKSTICVLTWQSIKFLAENTSLLLGPESGKIWWLKRVQ